MIDEILNKPSRTSKLLLLFILLAFSTYACKKGTPGFVDPPKPPVVKELDPAQYGTPFASVPDRRDVSLYQVNMRVFSSAGNFKGVIDRLDSIKALGVNVIYLMPIYPLGVVKSVNSPYCIKDYKSVSPEFGSLDDLRALVDGAHSRNMSVLLDWVANHTSFDHTWTNDRSWYLQDASGNIVSPPGMGWNDVAQLNFNNSAMRQSMIKAMKHWVFTANVDGFRFDYSDGPPVDFWKQAVDTLRNIKSHKLLLLAEGGRSANYSAGFDYNFGFGFFDKLKSIYGSNQSVKQIDNMNTSDYSGATDGQQIVRYLTNHDVNSSDGTPLELFGGKKGSMAAFVVVSYMKSIPMIYNGQEVGTAIRLTFPFTSTKINWSINPDVTAEYKKVIGFRNSSAAIRRGQLTSYNSDDVCAFTKESGTEKVFVLSNLRNSSKVYTLPDNLKNTTWKDGLTGASITLGTSISLDAFSYKILKN